MFHVVHAMSIPLGPDLSPRLCLLGCREGHPALASFFPTCSCNILHQVHQVQVPGPKPLQGLPSPETRALKAYWLLS